MCRPHLPRVGARVASALQCPSQFSGSLQHPVLGPLAVLGAPCHPARLTPGKREGEGRKEGKRIGEEEPQIAGQL